MPLLIAAACRENTRRTSVACYFVVRLATSRTWKTCWLGLVAVAISNAAVRSTRPLLDRRFEGTYRAAQRCDRRSNKRTSALKLLSPRSVPRLLQGIIR